MGTETESQRSQTETEALPAFALSEDGVRFMAQIISVVTARGAFKPEELSSVGAFYDKLLESLPQPPPTEYDPNAEAKADSPDDQLELNLDA